MSAETPTPSTDTVRESAPSTRAFLERLKADVETVGDQEGKKTLIRERLQTLKREEIDSLKQQIDGNLIPDDLLMALVDLRLLVDAQKDALRQAIENGNAPAATEKKPEGWMAWAGEQMKSGVETFTGWMKKFGSWTSEKAGGGWKYFLGAATATATAIGSGISWMREKAAHTFGAFVASVEPYLPEWDWLKKGLNFLMGDYGVLYKNFARFKIEVQPNASDQELSLQPFMQRFEMVSVTGQNFTFDEFCRLVALKLRENPAKRTAIPLKITQLELEQAADQVVQQRLNTPPAAPVASPVSAEAAPVSTASAQGTEPAAPSALDVAPAAAVGATVPAAAASPPVTHPQPTPEIAPSDVPASAPEQITRTEVQSLTVNGVEISKVQNGGETLLKMGEHKYRVRPHVLFGLLTPKVSVTKVEKISDGTVAITGALGLLSGTVIVTEQELGSAAAMVTGGKDQIEVTYRSADGTEQKRTLTFEVVPS